MQTKLTLRIDEDLVRQAKRICREQGRSLSGLVADYFAALGSRCQAADEELSPRVQALRGALKDRGVSIADYRRHVEAEQWNRSPAAQPAASTRPYW